MAGPEQNITHHMNNPNISGTNKQHNDKSTNASTKIKYGGASLGIVAIVALCLTLPITLKNKSDDNKSSITNQAGISTNSPELDHFASPSPLSSVSAISSSTHSTSIHLLAADPTIETRLSPSVVIDLTKTPTPTPTPTPTTKAQPSLAPQAVTSAPVYLTPGALCTANSQCSPNICYSEATGSTYCCGPSIWGCPGWFCTDVGHNDCKDPYTCNFQASTCEWSQ